MQDLPKPLMGCDKAFLGPAFRSSREIGVPHRHEFQDVEQFPGDLGIRLVACVMECDEDRVGQAPFRMIAGGVRRFLVCQHHILHPLLPHAQL
jgi:hypothetical protein